MTLDQETPKDQNSRNTWWDAWNILLCFTMFIAALKQIQLIFHAMVSLEASGVFFHGIAFATSLYVFQRSAKEL